MTEEALAEDTAALEDTMQDCLAIQTKVAEYKAYTNKSLSEELEALAKAKAVISEKTDNAEYRDNWSVLSSHGGLVRVLYPKARIRILRCTTRSLTATILSRRPRF